MDLEDQETPEWKMLERLSHMVIAVARENNVHTNSWAPGTSTLNDHAWYVVLMGEELQT